MRKVVLLGSGNLAVHLAAALQKTEAFELVQRYFFKQERKAYFPSNVATTNRLENLVEAELYILAVRDDRIEEVSTQITQREGLQIHCSGSTAMSVLKSQKKGVLYPVQSFSMDSAVDFSEIPLALEADGPESAEILKDLAAELSERLYHLDSAQREKLHLAAVFANNFSNHLFSLAENICQEGKIDFHMLNRLIQETAQKAIARGPKEAQTGPARRGDLKVIQKQRAGLNNQTLKVYDLLTQSLFDMYGSNPKT